MLNGNNAPAGFSECKLLSTHHEGWTQNCLKKLFSLPSLVEWLLWFVQMSLSIEMSVCTSAPRSNCSQGWPTSDNCRPGLVGYFSTFALSPHIYKLHSARSSFLLLATGQLLWPLEQWLFKGSHFTVSTWTRFLSPRATQAWKNGPNVWHNHGDKEKTWTMNERCEERAFT